MADYLLDNNTIAFYKFNDSLDPTYNSMTETKKMLFINTAMWPYGVSHYESNKLNYTKGANISSNKYHSRKSSLNIKYNENNNIYSQINFKTKDSIYPNSLEFDTFVGSSSGSTFSITTLNKKEWTIDFWLYPSFIRNGSDPIKFNSFMYLYAKTGYSYHTSFVSGYTKSLFTLGTNKFVFDIRQMRLFYSENDNIPYNRYITSASKTNYYLYVDMEAHVIYGSLPGNTQTMHRKFLIPLNINTNSWNHIAIIKSNDDSPAIAINGILTPIIKNYDKSISECFICSGSDELYFGSNTGSINITNLSTTRNIASEYTLEVNKPDSYSDPYYYPSDPTDTIQIIPANEIQKFTCDSYIDDLRFSQAALWSENFTPPGLIGRQIFVYDDYAYYNEPSTGNITKLSFAKWSSISDADKLTLLDRVSYNDLPSADQMKIIQTDPSKDIICYNYQTDTIKPSLKIEKIDQSRSEIVYPTQLMDYSAIQANIVNIFASGSTASTSNIRLAVTRDFNTYYTYNMTNNAWVPLDNKYDVKTDGILLSALKDIPKAAWIQFDLSKFAFSISLTKTYEADACQIDDIKLKVNLDSKWVKSIKGTQSKYKYVGATLLKVTFLEDGKYKVNYNDRG